MEALLIIKTIADSIYYMAVMHIMFRINNVSHANSETEEYFQKILDSDEYKVKGKFELGK